MADFGSTKYNVSFEEWHELLMDYAELRGGSAADAEAWRDDYEAGKTPVEASRRHTGLCHRRQIGSGPEEPSSNRQHFNRIPKAWNRGLRPAPFGRFPSSALPQSIQGRHLCHAA